MKWRIEKQGKSMKPKAGSLKKKSTKLTNCQTDGPEKKQRRLQLPESEMKDGTLLPTSQKQNGIL